MKRFMNWFCVGSQKCGKQGSINAWPCGHTVPVHGSKLRIPVFQEPVKKAASEVSAVDNAEIVPKKTAALGRQLSIDWLVLAHDLTSLFPQFHIFHLFAAFSLQTLTDKGGILFQAPLLAVGYGINVVAD